MDGLLIFDGDDTLWSTEQLYDAARAGARRLVASAGFDDGAWELAERQIDVENVVRFGLSRHRFPTSCVEALDKIAREVGRTPDRDLLVAVWREAAGVFDAEAPVMAGAQPVLELLAIQFDLALLTKGDALVQHRRLKASGLARLFREVEIVPEKSSETYVDLARRMGACAGSVTSVGNSLASDIRPAVEAGMRGIWIDAHVWEYERSRNVALCPDGVIVATSLLELPDILRVDQPATLRSHFPAGSDC